MRTSERLIGMAVAIGLGLVAGLGQPAHGFDGSRTPAGDRSPFEAFRQGTEAIRAGRTQQGVDALAAAADRGHVMAMFTLGRMYMGNQPGVRRDDVKAFDYFSRLADTNAEEDPASPHARLVAQAFVQVGRYYISGIPNSRVTPDLPRAREMFQYAASYFRDSEGQYEYGRMLMDGQGGPRDPRQAAKWFNLAAEKGHQEAQARLGHMLFIGRDVRRQAALGLMWLTVARDQAQGAEDKWIIDSYEAAVDQASDDERAMAVLFLERWLKRRRD
jgi:hypothetical protein